MSTLVLSRVGHKGVALETTLLLHGVPRSESSGLAHALAKDVSENGGEPAIVGLVAGEPIVGLNDDELRTLLDAGEVPKANTSNLGVLLAKQSHAATTVSTTMELAAAGGVRVFATGGLGGVHKGYAEQLDVSSDLAALTRFPVAVVASGVKGLLDVVATREALEAFGVPVIGFQTDRFPAFYVRESEAGVDARFDDVRTLADFVEYELARTRRGMLIVQPIAHEDAIAQTRFESWLTAAEHQAQVKGVRGRALTPFLLARLHELSGGATLRANIALVRANARLAGRIASFLSPAKVR